MASGSTITKTVVLGPGDSVVLPAGATITTLTLDGDITVSSSCGDNTLPDPTTYKCYFFNWEDDSSGSMQDAIFEYLKVGTLQFTVPAGFNGVNNTGIFTLGEWIQADAQLAGIVKFGCEQHSSDHLIKIKIPEGLEAPTLKIVNPFDSTSVALYMYGEEDTVGCDSCV